MNAATGKSVIVLDFAATSSSIHACLLAEVLEALPRLRVVPSPILVAAGPAPNMTTRVAFGPGEEFAIYAGPDLAKLKHECLAGGKRDNSVRVWAGAGDTLETLRGLANQFATEDAPVRLFWLAETFWWFDKRNLSCPGSSTYPCHEPPPNPVFEHLRAISDADVTVFPLVFGEHHNGRRGRVPHEQISEANYMAHYLGGFATPVNGAIGDTLLRVFEATGNGAVLSLDGPVTVGKDPKKLTIRVVTPTGSIEWQRPFFVNQESLVLRKKEWLVTPLVLPSSQFSVNFGCGLPEANPNASLGLTLPPEVREAPAGKLEVYLHYQNDPGLAFQRVDVNRPSGLSGPLCIPIIHVRGGTKFSIVVRDQSSGWLGALDGTLVGGNGR